MKENDFITHSLMDKLLSNLLYMISGDDRIIVKTTGLSICKPTEQT